MRTISRILLVIIKTNIIWKVQNNELNRQINIITTNTFNCGNYKIKLT